MHTLCALWLCRSDGQHSKQLWATFLRREQSANSRSGDYDSIGRHLNNNTAGMVPRIIHQTWRDADVPPIFQDWPVCSMLFAIVSTSGQPERI